MDRTPSPQEQAFRDELRAWLAANHPGPEPDGDVAGFEFRRAWQRRLHEAGRGEGLEWYDGPTLLEVLEELPVGHERPESFRFPVQWVCRPQASSDPAL